MNEWVFNGARWWQFDFHTHTPASDDYGKGSQQAQLKQRVRLIVIAHSCSPCRFVRRGHSAQRVDVRLR